MKQMLNRRKDFTSTPDDISIYLFEQFHWVYALGVGETHIVELIAIVFLSFYVYTTAMYDELMQLLYQLRAHGIFSDPEYVRQLMFPESFASNTEMHPTLCAYWHRSVLRVSLRYFKVRILGCLLSQIPHCCFCRVENSCRRAALFY